MERELVDKVYNKFMEVMGRSIMEGRKVILTINKVAGHSDLSVFERIVVTFVGLVQK